MQKNVILSVGNAKNTIFLTGVHMLKMGMGMA